MHVQRRPAERRLTKRPACTRRGYHPPWSARGGTTPVPSRRSSACRLPALLSLVRPLAHCGAIADAELAVHVNANEQVDCGEAEDRDAERGQWLHRAACEPPRGSRRSNPGPT
eukprot:CAMPEP_0179966810 /NCGR_PEP_ID=MMETSP0983-20121128/32754_1 /TAXON_ID=483367 /ORGANISM="non described non described, Strain CCMP 2436" /LENGTH=112 /DNA_ID=CAMNT_0021880015 /DNA_START=186 /DNA_END=520 /DNA_ORIENTATION=-